MKYTVEMGSGAVIYISSFIKIRSGIRNLMVEGKYRMDKIQECSIPESSCSVRYVCPILPKQFLMYGYILFKLPSV
jgi:hypothetical protein